jgi:two-component system OmpR family sensor kinase
MLLRTRLTLIFTMLLGGILLVSGFTVYINVSVLLVNDMDRNLSDTAREVISTLDIKPNQRFELQPLSGGLPLENFMFQIWGADGILQVSQPATLKAALDYTTLYTGSIVLESITNGNNHLRVLSIPLYSERGSAGVFQIAASLSSLDTTQKMLAIVLLITIVVGMALTGVISWLVTGTVMQPLESMVRIASQITRLDDLSRRIPLASQRRDEVGVLIHVFNQTLERLELLISSQQRFLADVSHDLRTPLTVIKGNAELIRKTGNADKESLAIIDQEVNRLTHMVGDLLLLAQAEAGQLPLDWDSIGCVDRGCL